VPLSSQLILSYFRDKYYIYWFDERETFLRNNGCGIRNEPDFRHSILFLTKFSVVIEPSI
jgi:hypothetical protein